MDWDEARAKYPTIYGGFNAAEWVTALPADVTECLLADPPRWRIRLPLLPMKLWGEFVDAPPYYPSWSEATAALRKAAQRAYDQGWRPSDEPLSVTRKEGATRSSKSEGS